MTRPRIKLSEDDRFELVLGAAGRERRNRPVGLLVAAACILIACAVFAVYAIGARATDRRGLIRAQQDQAKVVGLIEKWKTLAKSSTDSSGVVGQPGAFKVSRMEELATKAGMKTKPNTPRSIEDKTHAGIVLTRYIYTEVRDDNLKALVEWARSGCAEIPGLELESITLKPEPAGWKLDATFRIWERTGT